MDTDTDDLQIKEGVGWIQIHVRVQPRASSEELVGLVDQALKIRLTAPPAEGKANRALQAFLAKRLRIPKKQVEIIAGETSRLKQVRLHGVSPEDLRLAIPDVFRS